MQMTLPRLNAEIFMTADFMNWSFSSHDIATFACQADSKLWRSGHTEHWKTHPRKIPASGKETMNRRKN